MPKRTTDLLDVFRTRGGGGGGPERPRKGARKAKSDERGPFQGVFLAPRQLLLAGCVVLLLLVLAFVLGIGLGRGRAGLSARATLARNTGRNLRGWYLVDTVHRYRKVGGRDPSLDAYLDAVGLPRALVHLVTRPDEVDIYVGPYATKAQAEADRERRQLGLVGFGDEYPFYDTRYRCVKDPPFTR